MSYRLIDSNAIAIKYPEVNEMPCVFANLPDGLNGQFIDAQSHLIPEIQNGIRATDANDVYSCGMRNGMRWCMSLIDGKEPLYENCPSAQLEERTEKHTETHGVCLDAISRKAAIDELPYLLDYDGLKGENGFVSKRLVRKMLKGLPPAQPEYEPVTAEDFAKTMSETSVYSYMRWHSEAFALMERQGFVICKKTM